MHYRATTHIHVRTAANGLGDAQVLDMIRRELNAVDPRLPVVELTTMSGFHQRGLLLWVIRAAGRTLTAFGAVALMLAAIGVYGVMLYLASRRTHEFGVRLALGATRTDILRLVFRESIRTTGVGLLIGFPLALTVARLLRSAIYGVSPWDPVVSLGAPGVLVAAAGTGDVFAGAPGNPDHRDGCTAGRMRIGDRRQKTEDRRQKTENRRQEAGGRKQDVGSRR